MPKRYCIVVTLIAADSGPELSTLLGVGGTGLKDYESGRDQDASGEFARWVLSQGGVACTINNLKGNPEEVDVVALFAFNSNVSANFRTRMKQAKDLRPTLVRDFEFNPPVTRQQMADRLASEVGSNLGCSHYWHSKPGDDVTTGVTTPALLLAKFQAVPT